MLSRLTWHRNHVRISAGETPSKTVLTLQCKQGLAEDRGRKRSISITKQVDKSQKQHFLGQCMLSWSHRLPPWDTGLFLLICGTSMSHFYFFHYQFCVGTDLSSATARQLLRYLSCEQGDTLLSTRQGDVLHRTTGNSGEEFLSLHNQKIVCSA